MARRLRSLRAPHNPYESPAMPRPDLSAVHEPQEQRYTKWFNPLAVAQRVDVVENGRRVRYTFPPGEEKLVPGMHDLAIQAVLCADRDCRDRGGYCTKGHGGNIAAGLAPQLVNRGRSTDNEAKLPLALNTAASAKHEADVERELAERRSAEASVEAKRAQARAEIAGDDAPKAGRKLPPSMA